MRLTLFTLTILFPVLLLAADDTPQQNTEPEEQLQPAKIDPPADATDTDIILADVDEDADNTQESNRFIPTEEISQDLGVSFPVDI